MSPLDSDQQIVRDAVRVATRRSRSHRAIRLLARVAPVAAALVFLSAVAGYFAAWPTGVTFFAGVTAAAFLAVLVALARRTRASADAMAAEVDADAALRGELRSAHWFAVEESRDPWVLFHLERAAERVRSVVWSQVYPPVMAKNAWVATAVLSTAAFVLPLGLVVRHAVAAGPDAGAVVVLDGMMTPELREQVRAVLDAARRNGVPMEDVMGAVSAILGVRSSDPALRQQISELMKQNGFSSPNDRAVESAEMHDARGEGSASKDAKAMPNELRQALERLAASVARESESAKSRAEGEPSESDQVSLETSPAGGPPEGMQSTTGDQPGDMASQQAMTEASSQRSQGGAAAGEMMMDSDGASSSGTPGLGYGGLKGPSSLTGDARQIAAALKLELLEANTNIDGAMIQAEEARRKTDQGKSMLAFTKTAGLVAFDRAHGDVPPSVPEARRPLVQRYFVRVASPPKAASVPPPQPAASR